MKKLTQKKVLKKGTKADGSALGSREFPLHKNAKCIISLLKKGHTQPVALLDDLTELFRMHPHRVQRRMVSALFCALLYGSVEQYKFADTGDGILDDVLDDYLAEILFRLRGMDFFMNTLGMSWEKAFENYYSILKHYTYKSHHEH